MAKLTKDEMKNKMSEKIQDQELLVEILEDIEDSYDTGISPEVFDKVKGDLEKERDDYKGKYEDMQTKYKERFLYGEVDPEMERKLNPEPVETDEIEDVDIFKKIKKEEYI